MCYDFFDGRNTLKLFLIFVAASSLLSGLYYWTKPRKNNRVTKKNKDL